MEINKLLLRPVGMFSNVNEVVQQLYLAEKGNYRFIIDWSSSCYRDTRDEPDPWNYYFEDCFPDLRIINNSLPLLPYGPPVACTRDNIITPRLADNNCNPLLLPKDRNLPHRIIERYIIEKPHIRKIIEKFADKHFRDYVIGLHIRGPGRIDGGAPGLRSRYQNKKGVPFGQYFKYVDSQLKKYPEAGIFTCSDSEFVLNEVTQYYGDRIITHASTRSAFGEMHVPGHPANKGASFPAYKLGEDVLVEAYLLSRVNFFVHGNSNVVNFALCKNPSLEHKYVYE